MVERWEPEAHTGSLDFDPWDIEHIPLKKSCGCMVGGFRVVKRAIIDAPVEAVWKAAVTDYQSFPKWNPFHRQVETTLKAGSPYKFRMDMELTGKPIKDLDQFESQISYINNTNHILVYTSGSFYTGSNRVQAMRATGDGKTEYLTVDAIGGCIAWLIKCTYQKKVDRAFDAQIKALKEYVEPTG